jgi:hypothetical protein
MKTNTETPAARLAHELAQAVTGEQISLVLRQALSATTTTRAGTVEPDHKIRIEASRLLLAYSLGLPVQRTETVTVALDADANAGLHERLAKSPALRSALQAALDRSAPTLDVDKT